MMKNSLKIIVLLLLFGAVPFLQAEETENFYKVELVSVYDGDTFKVNLPCEYDIFCKKISVRVKGIDTPEIRTKDPCEKRMAKKAKAFTKEFLKSGPIILRKCEKDKYFRLLCDVSVRNPISLLKKQKNLFQRLFWLKN